MNRGKDCQSSGQAREAEGSVSDVLRREALSISFQPIVDLRTAEVAGCEALTRPAPSTGFDQPGPLFEAAEQAGLSKPLERVARQRALASATTWCDSPLLFINVSPTVFNDPEFVDQVTDEVARTPDIDPRRVVLEITERAGCRWLEGLEQQTRELRKRGFRIALDDVGAGMSGLNQIMALRPDWLKLDIALIRNIDSDGLKQNLIRFFVHFSRLSGMTLIAEGIERPEEMAILIELGVTHGQGFYLAKPAPIAPPIPPAVMGRIVSARQTARAREFQAPASMRVDPLIAPAVLADRTQTVSQLVDQVDQTARDSGVVVIDGRHQVGWIGHEVIRSLAREGAGDMTLGGLDLKSSPAISIDTTLTEALELVAGREEELCGVPLVVQHEGNVVGVVPIPRLLRAVADTRRSTRLRAAPLTGLPTRVQADQWITSQIKAGDPVDVAFIDLRAFQSYNLAYSFERGDAMLLKLVGLIKAEVMGSSLSTAFLAHLGEDRFLLACRGDHREHLRRLILSFDESRVEFFSEQDREVGAFLPIDASESTPPIPLTTVRVVYFPGALRRFGSARELFNAYDRLRKEDSFSGSDGGVADLLVDDEPDVGRHKATA